MMFGTIRPMASGGVLAGKVAVIPGGGSGIGRAPAIAFARERLLKDGSVAVIRTAVNERQRGAQARGYLVELGATAPCFSPPPSTAVPRSKSPAT